MTTEVENKRTTNRKASIILSILAAAFFLCVSGLAFALIWNIASSLLAGPAVLLSLGHLLAGGVA